MADNARMTDRTWFATRFQSRRPRSRFRFASSPLFAALLASLLAFAAPGVVRPSFAATPHAWSDSGAIQSLSILHSASPVGAELVTQSARHPVPTLGHSPAIVALASLGAIHQIADRATQVSASPSVSVDARGYDATAPPRLLS